MSNTNSNDPLEFLKSMWDHMGFSLPGMVTPTLDTNELDKRISDLKAVEGWLKVNLNMLQMTIQGLEVQKATLDAMQTISKTTANTEPGNNPFANAAMWPWTMMQQTAASTAAGQQAAATSNTAKKESPKPDQKAPNTTKPQNKTKS